MNIAIVAARSQNNVIGRGIEIPWRVKGEQKLFKEITMGGCLIMGRITYDSIGRPLPGRDTIIITRNSEYHQPGCYIANSLEQSIETASKSDKPIFIVGGGDIYRQAIPLADTLHLTTIQTNVEGDVLFPDFSLEAFELSEQKSYVSNINYVYQVFKRRVN